MHQNFVFDTPGCVGGQCDIFIPAVGSDGLDQTDGADGNQILLIRTLGIVFFGGLMPVKVA